MNLRTYTLANFTTWDLVREAAARLFRGRRHPAPLDLTRSGLDLTIDQLQTANELRSSEIFPQCNAWTPMQWGCALGGESGEAQNVLKKIERDGLQAELVDHAIEELSDTVMYACLAASALGRRLAPGISGKFNRVSLDRGSRYRLGVQQ